MRFGLEYPERTGKIVLQASSPGGPNWFTPSPPQGIQALTDFQTEPSYENMRRDHANFVPKAELLTEDMVNRRFEMALIPGHLEARLRNQGARNADLRPRSAGCGRRCSASGASGPHGADGRRPQQPVSHPQGARPPLGRRHAATSSSTSTRKSSTGW